MAGKKTGKRLLTWVLVLVMALSLLPLNALAARNSTVELHPSVGSTVTGVNVKVGDKISGYTVSSISGYDITVDLGKYNVNNNTFRLPYAKDIWKGVDNNKVDYISWAGSGSNRRSEGASALLANGKNTAYYYFKGAPVLPTFTLNYNANGGTGAPASQTYKATSEYEKSHTFTIASQVPTCDGYTFLGWNTNRSATTANYQPDGSIVVTGTTTLYAVWEENTPPKPDKPTAPDEGNLSGLIGDITVNCTNTEATHSDKIKTYALIEDSYTTSEVAGDAENGYTCTVTINSQKYVEQFDSDTGATHTPKDATATVTLEYKNSAWLVKSGTPISFNVVCDAAPDDPKVGDNFDFDKNIVDVFCETTSDHNDSYGLMNDYYTVSDRKQLQNGNWQCEITINLDKYFALYNSEHPGHTRDKEHKEATSIMRIYPTWYASSGKWIFVGTGTAKIFVKCDAVTPPTEPSKEDIKELLGSNAVQIICTNNESGHGSKTFGLIDGTFSVRYDGQYTCEVKIDSFNEYVYSFNTELGVAQGTHASDNSKTGQQIINLKWMNGKWTVVDAPAEHYVLCETPKYTVTYTDGVENEEIFADQVYRDLLSGTATPAFNGGKPTRTGYVFAGWEPEVAETVTGNATYTAKWKEDKNHNNIPDDEEEKYTVTYTDGAANGASFTEQKHENLLSGEATPAWVGTADKPVWEDHFFAGWEPEVAPTVTGNATYVAQWKDDKNNNGTPDDEEEKYTVTYTDGAANGASFTEQKHENLLSGEATPAWVGTADKPVWEDHVFAGWEPEVAEKVTENATYAAQWKEDKNNNGIPDENEDKYTVTYTDGVNNEEVFADQVYGNLLSGTATPAFNGTPTRNGYRFAGWNPAVADNVTESVTYAAQWTPRTDLSYTVHYYLKNTTKQVADDKTVNGQTFNADVTEKAIRISGYRVYGDSVKSITIGTGTNEIIFYYTRASRPSASSTSKPTLNTGDHYAYVMGYPDGTVRPNGSITRAEVSAILFRLLSDKTRDEYFTTESSFTDVKAGAWYNNSIATLEKAGVIVDTAKGGAFRPNEAITRAELAAMLAQFSDAKPVKGVKFSDVSAEHWAYEAIAIAAKMGWIEGYPDGTFRPDATITRAEMMTLVNRALERVPSDEDHLLSKRVMLTFPDCKSGDWFYIAVQEATNSHTYERAATEKNGDEQWTALRANRDWTQLEK